MKKEAEKKAYLAVLDKQRNDKLRSKLDAETSKREEHVIKKKEEEILKRDTEMKQIHDKMYHQYMHESYLATVNMHQDKKKEEILRIKEEERRKLQKIQEDLENEKYRKEALKSQRITDIK